MYNGDYIPMEKWGKDHWSTLAYLETVIVDCGGFQVGYDPHMRHCRRHFRVMREECPSPRRHTKKIAPGFGIAMAPDQGTVLKGGKVIEGHDDWHCVQDMAVAGLFMQKVEDVDSGVILKLSPMGQAIAEALRRFKAKGGNFSDFKMAQADIVAAGEIFIEETRAK